MCVYFFFLIKIISWNVDRDYLWVVELRVIFSLFFWLVFFSSSFLQFMCVYDAVVQLVKTEDGRSSERALSRMSALLASVLGHLGVCSACSRSLPGVLTRVKGSGRGIWLLVLPAGLLFPFSHLSPSASLDPLILHALHGTVLILWNPFMFYNFVEL